MFACLLEKQQDHYLILYSQHRRFHQLFVMKWEALSLLAHHLVEDQVRNFESFTLNFHCFLANMHKNHLGVFGKNTYLVLCTFKLILLSGGY